MRLSNALEWEFHWMACPNPYDKQWQLNQGQIQKEGEMKDIFKIEQCSKSKAFGSVWGVNNRLQSDKTMLRYFVEY